MSRNRNINKIFALLFAATTAVSVLAQQPKEPYLEAAERAALAMRERDFDAAIRFYTEAIDLFPKINAYVPKNRVIKLADGKFTENPYTGLDTFYASRAVARLNKRELKAAENDYADALKVLKHEIKKNLDKANNSRGSADIKKESKIGLAHHQNSDLMRAVFSFSGALTACEKAVWLNRKRKENYRDLRIPLSMDEQNIAGFDEIVKDKEKSLFGRAEAYAVSAIEAENKAHSFWALKYADELVAAFPNNIEAYRLRAKVNRHWKRDEAALADDRKAADLSSQR
jgi:tetratricopeptide (TPR) repeat protein